MLKRSAGFLLAAALGLAACSSGDPDGSGSGSGPTPVTVASLKVAGSAPVELAQQKGFFKKEGLDVKLKYVEPAAAVPSVLGDQVQFAMLNAPAVLVAQSNNVPVTAVAGLNVPNDDPADYPIHLLAAQDGPIRTPKDLVGRKIAVDTLFQLPDLSLRTALREAGVDPAKVEFVEMPFPQMAEALKAGRADAVNLTEPFITMAREDGGMREVLSDSYGQTPQWPHSVMLASSGYADKNPEIVADFRRAIEAAVRYAEAHPDEVREVIPLFTKVPADIAHKMKLPSFKSEFSRDGWQKWADVLRKEGAVKDDVDVSAAYRTDG